MKNKALNRARIDKELKKLFNYPLTIISASMGYGKTTSVRCFLEKQNIKHAWVSCLGCGGLEYLFWDRVINAFSEVSLSLSEKLKQVGFPFTPQQIADSYKILEKAQNIEPIVLVLDDYHLMESSCALTKYIEMTAQQELPNLHVVLISRTRPKFNHTNLQSKNI